MGAVVLTPRGLREDRPLRAVLQARAANFTDDRARARDRTRRRASRPGLRRRARGATATSRSWARVDRVDRCSSLVAAPAARARRGAAGRCASCLRPLRTFLRNYVVLRGVRQGVPGFLWCAAMSAADFLGRAKLWRLQRAGRPRARRVASPPCPSASTCWRSSAWSRRWSAARGLPLRLFTDGERAYAAGRARPGQHLAARFCAKEAVAKALRLEAWSPRDIEVVGEGARPRRAARARSPRSASRSTSR